MTVFHPVKGGVGVEYPLNSENFFIQPQIADSWVQLDPIGQPFGLCKPPKEAGIFGNFKRSIQIDPKSCLTILDNSSLANISAMDGPMGILCNFVRKVLTCLLILRNHFPLDFSGHQWAESMTLMPQCYYYFSHNKTHLINLRKTYCHPCTHSLFLQKWKWCGADREAFLKNRWCMNHARVSWHQWWIFARET